MRNPQGNIAFVLCNPMQYESSASLMYKYYFWLMTWLIEILYHPSMRHVLNNFRYYRATALPTFVGYMLPLHVLSLSEGEFPQDDHEKFRQAHEQRPSLNGDHLLCEAGYLADQLEDTNLKICNAFTLRWKHVHIKRHHYLANGFKHVFLLVTIILLHKHKFCNYLTQTIVLIVQRILKKQVCDQKKGLVFCSNSSIL